MENELLQILMQNIADLPLVILLVWFLIQERKERYNLFAEYKQLYQEYIQSLERRTAISEATVQRGAGPLV